MPRYSRLARLLQLVLLAHAAAALAWIAWCGARAPVGAAAGALFILLLGPLVLALEFVMSALANRRDGGAPEASPLRLLVAWFVESVQLYRVFAWRQPFRWQAVDDHLEPGCAGRTGVVFIHGFMCNRGFWNAWMRRVRARGHACIAVNLEPVFGGIDAYAPMIEAAVARVAQATGCAPMLVCHSMGGLAARAWWRASGGRQAVAALVTIGTPHAGTWMGRFSLHDNGRQMRLGSDWLRALALHESTHALPRTMCWYSNADNMVFPAATATLPGADNRFVAGCPHVGLAFATEVMEATLRLLDPVGASSQGEFLTRTSLENG